MSFSKRWNKYNCKSRFGECNFISWKTHKCKLISNWTRKTAWLLINNTNMKKFARRKCRKIFLEAIIVAFEKTFFRVSVRNIFHCFTWYQLTYKRSHCLSANHNPQLRWEICTGITLFVPVLHLNCTALSQSESSNFFMCIINWVINTWLLFKWKGYCFLIFWSVAFLCQNLDLTTKKLVYDGPLTWRISRTKCIGK